ncbi:glycosyltransferase [Dyadobacter sp. CY312]|uniref:glycosyltransferase n=1 Tax=Dyadobacter sp. CY312 TaxID=2907303 RepID=UPI001F39618D|nr:glycosyltransferase [Dyadobacter sp. CY312]MCE7038816.1 glycosyltransferase family protein [Dyadobacter sp. CY312]
MISIIICSANEQDLKAVSQNISETIGVVHEIIAIDNSDGKKGICEIYNIGARKAQYDVMCFMHEDIEMVSQDWGRKLIEIFEMNPKIGLVGVAGGGYKSVVPSSWYNADLESNGAFYCNLIQGFKYSRKPEFHDYRNPRNQQLSLVACIDGCWMCTRKSISEKYPFDSDLLQSFHGYDLDFSLAVSQEYNVAVTYEILLRHFSEGKFDDGWEEDTLKVHKKWSRILPVNTDRLDESTLSRYERRAYKVYFNKSLDKNISYKKLMTIIGYARQSRIFPLRVHPKLYLDLWKVSRERIREGKH